MKHFVKQGLQVLVFLFVAAACSSSVEQQSSTAPAEMGACGSQAFKDGVAAIKNYRQNFDPLDSSQYGPISNKLNELADIAEAEGEIALPATLRGVADDIDEAAYLLERALADITDRDGLEEASDAAGKAAQGLTMVESTCD